jgi:hypothetical protein
MGLVLVIRLTPAPVLEDCRARSEAVMARPRSFLAACFIIALWLISAAALTWWVWR